MGKMGKADRFVPRVAVSSTKREIAAMIFGPENQGFDGHVHSSRFPCEPSVNNAMMPIRGMAVVDSRRAWMPHLRR